MKDETITKPRFRVRADGWIRHFGGPCPVPGDTRVEIEFPDGAKALEMPACWWSGGKDWWLWEGVPYTNIVAWRYAQ